MKNIFEILFMTFLLIENGFTLIWNTDEDNINCPKECFCQNAHFMDLSVSRWINILNSANHLKILNYKEDEDDLINNNEAFYENDNSYLTNQIMKQATCIFQRNTKPTKLIEQLPHDIQSLVILYSEINQNLTVPTSSFKSLNQLTTLEIRGSSDQSLKLLIDEPLEFLINANFESIKLEGSELFKRPKNPIHPSESFDYVPNSEKMGRYNVSIEIENEFEILPYEIYLMEMKKSRMPTFYKWKNLEVLRIYRCKLDELHWEMFDGLSELQHLSLEENNIKIIPAFALYGALHIKTLSLANNNILDLHYRSLAGLLDLEILNLSHNNLTKLSELTFPPFPKLEVIDFRFNPIHYIFPATFGVMNATQTMYLGSEDTILELNNNKPFESLNMLKHLIVNNASIELLNQHIFKNLKEIERIEIHGYVGKIDFDAFVGLQQLKELNLSYCRIQEISMDAFMGSINIKIIDLSNNDLSYIQPGIFDDQINLVEIYLQNNKLKYLPTNFFTNRKLKLIRLTGNPWKCTCDMTYWNRKITNQYRNINTEKCIKDFQSDKIISCRTITNYSFDNKLSPRCKNFKNRSLYYVLRHDLQCMIQNMVKKRQKFVRNNKINEYTDKNYKMGLQRQKYVTNNISQKNKNLERNLNKKKNSKNKNHINSLKYLTTRNNNQNIHSDIEQFEDLDSFNII